METEGIRPILAATLPAYKTGDAVPIVQIMNVPINLFGLRKELEKFGFEDIEVKIFKMYPNSRDIFTLGLDIEQLKQQNPGVSTTDQIYQIIANKFGIESTIEALSQKTHEILARHYTK